MLRPTTRPTSRLHCWILTVGHGFGRWVALFQLIFDHYIQSSRSPATPARSYKPSRFQLPGGQAIFPGFRVFEPWLRLPGVTLISRRTVTLHVAAAASNCCSVLSCDPVSGRRVGSTGRGLTCDHHAIRKTILPLPPTSPPSHSVSRPLDLTRSVSEATAKLQRSAGGR